jgi:prophage regulatory protein
MLDVQSVQPTTQVIRLKEVILITGLSRSTIYAKQDPGSSQFDPAFPQKIKLGARAVGWLKGDMLTWLDSMQCHSTKSQGAL